MKPVIGIDTNSGGFHWASTIQIGDDYYGWQVCKDRNPDVRRIEMTEYAFRFFDHLRQDHWSGVHVFCEEPLALQNGKTTRLLGLAAGAIYGAFVLSRLEAWWHWVDQSSWKKDVLGRGVRPRDFVGEGPKAGWEKEWIRSVVLDLPGYHSFMNPIQEQDFKAQPDLFDAWAIKTYGVRALAKERQ